MNHVDVVDRYIVGVEDAQPPAGRVYDRNAIDFESRAVVRSVVVENVDQDISARVLVSDMLEFGSRKGSASGDGDIAAAGFDTTIKCRSFVDIERLT